MSDYITAQQINRLICKQVLDAFRYFGADTVCPNPALGGTIQTGFSRLPGKNHFPGWSYHPGGLGSHTFTLTFSSCIPEKAGSTGGVTSQTLRTNKHRFLKYNQKEKCTSCAIRPSCCFFTPDGRCWLQVTPATTGHACRKRRS